VHKHDHEDIIVMLRGSFTIRVGEEDIELREGDTLIIPPYTIHTPISASAEGCELIGMSVTNIRTFQPDGTEIGVGFESLRRS
jgi:quercetin dioxygenase-like cupin family protein